jgi:hypothetical protein
LLVSPERTSLSARDTFHSKSTLSFLYQGLSYRDISSEVTKVCYINQGIRLARYVIPCPDPNISSALLKEVGAWKTPGTEITGNRK